MTHVGWILLVASLCSLHDADCVKDLKCYMGSPQVDDFKEKRGFDDWKHESCVGDDLCLRLVRHSQPDTIELSCANASASHDVPALGCQIVDNGVEEIQRCFCNTAFCNKDETVLPDHEDGPKWNPPLDVWGHAKPKADTVKCYTGFPDVADYAIGRGQDLWPTKQCEGMDRCMRVIRIDERNRVELNCGQADAYSANHPLGCQMLEDDIGEMQRCYCKKDLCNSQHALLPGSQKGLEWSDDIVLRCYVCSDKAVADCQVEVCDVGVTVCVSQGVSRGVSRGVSHRMCGIPDQVYKLGCDKKGDETHCYCDKDLCNSQDEVVLRGYDKTAVASRGVDLARDASMLFSALLGRYSLVMIIG